MTEHKHGFFCPGLFSLNARIDKLLKYFLKIKNHTVSTLGFACHWSLSQLLCAVAAKRSWTVRHEWVRLCSNNT